MPDSGSAAVRPVSPVRLAHIVLRTSRFDALIAWYTQLLGAHVVFANPMLAFLTYDEEHHRIALINVPGLAEQAPGAAGLHHVAFTYAGLADLVATWERLAAAGVTPVWCTNHGPTTSLYYRDPDGNQIELQVDNFDSVAEAARFFESPDFAANPIGVDFDPAELARRFHAGEALDSLRRRPPSGPRGLDAAVGIR